MSQVKVGNLAQYGVISDVASFEVPSNAWTTSNNVSFRDGGVQRSGNRTEVLVPATSDVNNIYIQRGAVFYTNSERVYRNTGVANVDISKDGMAYTPSNNWSITELSNVIVFNNGRDTPQMLLPTSGVLDDLTAWGYESDVQRTWQSPVIRSYKSFLIAIGMQESGVDYLQRVRWSDLAIPNQAPPSWDATSTTNSAGFNDLTQARGELLDGLPLGDDFLLYTSQEVFLMQYVGGSEIFRFRKVIDNLSILAPECVCQVNGGHFLVTTSDIVIHNGNSWKSVIEGKVREELFNAIGDSDYTKVRVQYYPAQQEAWVLYPSAGGSVLTKAAIYDLRGQTWTFRDLPNVTAIAYGTLPASDSVIINEQEQIIDTDVALIDGVGQDFVSASLVVVSSNLKWYAMDEGNAGGNNIPSSILKKNIDFDEWGVEHHVHKQITRIYPQFRGTGTVYISVGTSESPYETPVFGEAIPFNIQTDRKVDLRKTGRYISIKFETFESTDWTLMGYVIEGTSRGNR